MNKKHYILALALSGALMVASNGCTKDALRVPDEKKQEEVTKDKKNEEKNQGENTINPNGTNAHPAIEVPFNPIPQGIRGLRAGRNVAEMKNGERKYFNYGTNGTNVSNGNGRMDLYADGTLAMPPVDPDNYTARMNAIILEQAGREGVKITRTRNATRDDFLYSEQFVFDRKSDQIFLGNVIQGSSAYDGSFIPLKGAVVQPIIISTALVAQGEPIRSQQIQPSLSAYRDVVNGWMGRNFKPTACRTSTEIRDIQLTETSGTKSGFDLENALFKLGLKLDIAREKRRTHILVKFIQSAYSVAMDRPNGCLLLDFDKTAFLQDRTRPLYISNIEYGRAYYILISSSYSSDEVKIAFNLSGKPSEDGTIWNLFSESYYKKIREEAIINASLVGGTSTDHGVLVAQGWEAFKQSLANQFPLTAAEPIAIGLNFVDNNAPAQVLYTGTANTKESIFIPKCRELTVKMSISGVKATAGFKGIGKVRLFGKGYISVKGKARQEFFNIPQSQYINLPKGLDEFVTPSRPDLLKTTEIRIPMSGGKLAMERKLRDDVEIELELAHSGAYGGGSEKMGKLKFKMTLAEFLFYSQDGGFTISTRENRLMDFQGDLRIRMEPFQVK